ncbi:hypothetical protein AFLA_006672 [Aspergillus flavus NRRL3357]|nr:hypothetical protein AFLA_006672 [Aspergillus flavus NRRL3357]
MDDLESHEPMSSMELLFTLVTNRCTLKYPTNIESLPDKHQFPNSVRGFSPRVIYHQCSYRLHVLIFSE